MLVLALAYRSTSRRVAPPVLDFAPPKAALAFPRQCKNRAIEYWVPGIGLLSHGHATKYHQRW